MASERAPRCWTYIEDDWVVGPSSLTVCHPPRFRMVALGTNPVLDTPTAVCTLPPARPVSPADVVHRRLA